MAVRTSVKYTLLTRGESDLGVLDGVLSGSISQTTANSVHGTATMSMAHAGQRVNYLNQRIMMTIEKDGIEHPMGIWIPARPKMSYTATGPRWDVSLMDKTTLLDQTGPGNAFSVSKGTVITDRVAEIIESIGESAGAITESDKTLKGDASWEPGTSWLKIINDLLSSGNFFSLWVDGRGAFQVTPHRSAASRPIEYEFRDGENCVYSPDFEKTQDLWKVPNEVVVVSRESGDEPAIVGIARNDDPDDDLSTANRPVVQEVETGVEVSDQDAADAHAAERLQSLSGTSTNIVIEHEWVNIVFNNAVRFRRDLVPSEYRLDARYTVQRQEIDLGSPAFSTKTTLREVKS